MHLLVLQEPLQVILKHGNLLPVTSLNHACAPVLIGGIKNSILNLYLDFPDSAPESVALLLSGCTLQ